MLSLLRSLSISGIKTRFILKSYSSDISFVVEVEEVRPSNRLFEPKSDKFWPCIMKCIQQPKNFHPLLAPAEDDEELLKACENYFHLRTNFLCLLSQLASSHLFAIRVLFHLVLSRMAGVGTWGKWTHGRMNVNVMWAKRLSFSGCHNYEDWSHLVEILLKLLLWN